MRVSTLIAAALMTASSVQPYSVTISSETKGIGALYVNGQKVTDLYNSGNVDSSLSLGGGRHIVSYSFTDNDGDGAAAFASRAVNGATVLGSTGSTSVKYLTGDAPAAFTDFGFDDSAWSSSGLATCAFNPSSASKFVWPTSCATGTGPQKVNVRYAFELNPLIVTFDSNALGTTASGPVPITVRLESKPACNVQVEIQNPTATTQLSACTLTFTPDNWNVGQTVQLTIKHWATPNQGSVDLPLTFKTTASSSSTACYADMPLHCFQQPLTLTKRYDTGAVGTCVSWGDPHFTDFDKSPNFDFMGTSGDHFYYVDTPEFTFQSRHILWGSATAGMTASNAYAVRYLNYLAISNLASKGAWIIYGNPPSNIMSASGTTLLLANGAAAGGATIPVAFGGSYLSVQPFSVSPKFTGRTRGLCGNFNRVANEQATSANNWNGDAYVVNGRVLRDIGTTTTRFLSSANAGPLFVQTANRYITDSHATAYAGGVSNLPEIAAFNLMNSQGSCPAVVGSTCPAGPSKPQPPVVTPNSPPPSCVGNCGEVVENPPPPPAQTTVVEYFTSTTTDANGAPTVVVGSNVVILSAGPANLTGGSPNDTDLSAALIAAGVIGAVAVIGMGAFLLRRRRQMVQETADTMYSVQSVIANSQGNVGNQFLENPIYENDIQQASGDNLRMDSDQYSTISSVHQLATQMSGVTALGNSGTGSMNRPPSVAGSVRAGSVRSAQFTRE